MRTGGDGAREVQKENEPQVNAARQVSRFERDAQITCYARGCVLE